MATGAPRLDEAAAATAMSAFIREDYKDSLEVGHVAAVANRLLAYMNEADVRRRLVEENQPKRQSHAIQAVFQPFATALGFRNEAKGLFAEYKTTGLRPDYYLPLADSGILLEVERGKTTKNNMDMLDFWKCHLCRHAHYLFLVVPLLLRHNNKKQKTPTKEYDIVRRRLETFFIPGNETNVRGLFVFGY